MLSKKPNKEKGGIRENWGRHWGEIRVDFMSQNKMHKEIARVLRKRKVRVERSAQKWSFFKIQSQS